MIIIGITGNIGCGKTTVAKLFARRGVRVIDADDISHQVIKRKTVSSEIASVFGTAVLNNRRIIDRKKLARIAFSGIKEWRLLCGIVHPVVIDIIESKLRRARKDKKRFIVIDAPLLIEAGLDKKADYIVVVRSDLNQQIKRTRCGLGLNSKEFRDRLRFQIPFEKKMKKADFIIDNNKTIKFTERQVDEIWKKITNR